VGLFRTDREGPDALLGFAWGWWNGQSVSYFAGASSRPSDLRGVGIVHPLFWDLIVWAKRAGATWFDLGGATAGTAGSGDPHVGARPRVDLYAPSVRGPRPGYRGARPRCPARSLGVPPSPSLPAPQLDGRDQRA